MYMKFREKLVPKNKNVLAIRGGNKVIWAVNAPLTGGGEGGWSLLVLLENINQCNISYLKSSRHLLNWGLISTPVWHDSDSLQTVDTTPCFCLFSSEVHFRAVTDKVIFTPHYPEFTKAQRRCSSHVLLKYKHTLQKQMPQASRLIVKYTHSIWVYWFRWGACFLMYTTHWCSAQRHTLKSLHIKQSLRCSLNVLQYKMNLRLIGPSLRTVCYALFDNI